MLPGGLAPHPAFGTPLHAVERGSPGVVCWPPGGKPLWFCVTVEPVPDGARHSDAMVLRSQ
jgi:hypothetical protein